MVLTELKTRSSTRIVPSHDRRRFDGRGFGGKNVLAPVDALESVPELLLRGYPHIGGEPCVLYGEPNNAVLLTGLVHKNTSMGTHIYLAKYRDGYSRTPKTVIAKAVPTGPIDRFDGWEMATREFHVMKRLFDHNPVSNLNPLAMFRMRLPYRQEGRQGMGMHGVILMEYRNGDTVFLDTMITPNLGLMDRSKTRLNSDMIRYVGDELFQRLSEAHELGIDHRDLKPDHVMVIDPIMLARKTGVFTPIWRLEDSKPIIAVFDHGASSAVIDCTNGANPPVTPLYVSPETARLYFHERADRNIIGPASDQYQLGLILYEMFTGQVPDAFFSERQRVIQGFECTKGLPPVVYDPLYGIPYARARGKKAHNRRSFIPLHNFPLVYRSGFRPVLLNSFFEKILADEPNDRFIDIDAARRAFGEVTQIQTHIG